VTFDPRADAQSPLVRIESDGAVAGDWAFRVHVTDTSANTTVKTQRITVANTPPAVQLQTGAVLLSHSYLAPADRYVATAWVTAILVDADGDPLGPPELSMAEKVPGSCGFRVLSSALTAGVFTGDIELSCAGDAGAELIGRVDRTLTLTVTDVNGATATDVRPMTVIDAPPALTWSAGGVPGTLGVGHTVVPCPAGAEAPLCFAVDASVPYDISDVEGDPTSLRLSVTGLPASSAFFTSSVAAGRFSYLVPVTNPVLLRGADGVSPIAITVGAADPWKGTSAAFGLSIGNRAPAIAPLPAAGPSHWYEQLGHAYHATFEMATASDPDLDPLTAMVTNSDGTCSLVGLSGPGAVQIECSVTYDPDTGGPPALPTLLTPRTVSARVTDPWGASAATSAQVSVKNRAPAIGNGSETVAIDTTCTCDATACEWQPAPGGSGLLDLQASDPDPFEPDGLSAQIT
jgi:hypothetical protein